MIKEGFIIGERYQVISKIGVGGMADVYKAKDQKLNRLVAVKVLKPEFREDTKFISKFRSEAQAAAGLAHPNVVNVYDVGEDRGIYYIVMELVEGITLKNYITKKGKLSIKEATSIAIQVSLGLEAAHKRGIVHRDVKPQNIIISTDGKVKLSDFGIARAASSNTISANVMGSVHYSSPEQVRGGYSDSKSDIYSLGITMYEMVTGRVPFDGETTVAIAIKHLQEEIIEPSAYAPGLPRSLEQIILKCTQKSVDRRYNDMTEIINDLKHSLMEPDGDFVRLTPLTDHAQTVMISKAEMDAIRSKRPAADESRPAASAKKVSKPVPEYDEYEEDEEDDDEYEEYDEYDDDEDGINSRLEKAITIGGFIIGAIIIFILIYFIGQAAGLFKSGDSNKGDNDTKIEQPQDDDNDNQNNNADDEAVEVPDFRNMTVEQAQTEAAKWGLQLQKSGEAPSDTVDAGKIMEQDIPAKTKTKKNTVIKYVLSTGTGSVTLTDMVGESQSKAEKELKAMGLEVSVEQVFDDDVAAGKVISMDPKSGTSVAKGDTVKLVVSKGKKNEKISVPKVIGENEEVAREMLNDVGLELKAEYLDEFDSRYASGAAISQSPKSGNKVETGSTVTVTFNNIEVSSITPEPAEEIWKCNSTLKLSDSVPEGSVIRLVLVQQVNGAEEKTEVLTDHTVTAAEVSGGIKVNVTGAAGVSEGSLILAVKQSDGSYVDKVKYNATFKKQ